MLSWPSRASPSAVRTTCVSGWPSNSRWPPARAGGSDPILTRTRIRAGVTVNQELPLTPRASELERIDLMKSSGQRKLKWALVCCLGGALFLSLGIDQLAQTKIPAPTGHVNDFAGVLNEQTRQQLENILTNLKLKTGIEFDIATVQSTGDQTISTFSQQLAKDWNIG